MILCFICVVKFKAQCLVLIFIKFKGWLFSNFT